MLVNKGYFASMIKYGVTISRNTSAAKNSFRIPKRLVQIIFHTVSYMSNAFKKIHSDDIVIFIYEMLLTYPKTNVFINGSSLHMYKKKIIISFTNYGVLWFCFTNFTPVVAQLIQ